MTRPLTIAVRLTGGMGDVLLASPFLEQMHEILESCEITAYYHSPKVAEFVLAGARSRCSAARRFGSSSKGIRRRSPRSRDSSRIIRG